MPVKRKTAAQARHLRRGAGTVPVTISLPPEALARLDALAEEHGSRSAAVVALARDEGGKRRWSSACRKLR